MQILATKFPEVLLIAPDVYEDARGLFFEIFHQKKIAQYDIHIEFHQDNFSYSKKNVIRGLHYQLQQPQAKLVSVLRGKVYDVIVDIRKNSPTFGAWYGVELNDQNRWQLFIPKGFAHGFSVLSDDAEFFYKCSDFYNKEDERGILWNDADLNIDWKVIDPIISAKDQLHPTLKQISLNDLPNYPT